MFHQTFELFDLVRIAFLLLLELILSADNAIVLGLIIRSLPEKLRQKALFVGFASAFAVRGAALFLASYLLEWRTLQIVAGLYLIYVGIRHFYKKQAKTVPSASSFWKTVWLIELFDALFAIDSILAAVAFIHTIPSSQIIHPKLWIVFAGALFGLIILRFAAKAFSALIDRFPSFERIGFLMVGWIGLKLAISAAGDLLSWQGHWIDIIYWIGLSILFASGFRRKRHG